MILRELSQQINCGLFLSKPIPGFIHNFMNCTPTEDLLPFSETI
jgi:hypothetical protein